MDFDEPELISEAVTPTQKNKIKNKHLNVSVVDKMDKETNIYIDFSSLSGLKYSEFKKNFFALCKSMKDEYSITILMIALEDYLAMNSIDSLLSNSVKEGNSLANIICLLKESPKGMNDIGDFVIIFSCGAKWFAVNLATFIKANYNEFTSNLKMLSSNLKVRNVTGTDASSPTTQFEDPEDIELSNIEKDKEELMDRISDIADNASSEEEAIDRLNADQRAIDLIRNLEDSEYGKPKMTNARSSRLAKVNDEFLASTVNGKTVKEMIEEPTDKELPETSIEINSPNEEWKNMKFVNFNKEYDIDEDIVAILESFADKEYPIVVKSLKVEDTSTSLDYVYTYHVEMEDSFGKRFTIHIDVPKFINNRFMMLRGNQKVISGQLINLPCTKTDQDTVQLVSNYNKIFIYRYGSIGKSYPSADRLLKTLRKYKGKKIKIAFGDNRKICDRYELPIDYIDLAAELNTIETPYCTYYFNQDSYKKYGVDRTNGIPVAIYKDKQEAISYIKPTSDDPISLQIARDLANFDEEFLELYNSQKPASKHMYSRAKIMSGYIPLIVVICNRISFNELLNRTKVKYRIEEKRVKYDPDKEAIIKFNDGYFVYELTYESSMLLNGLLDCPTEEYSISDLNNRRTWIEFLDNFGGRILADGLDNFAELFMDPITVDVCKRCGIPTDYVDLLIYANNMLADNKYIKHTDISGNRYRTNEIIAGHLYKALAMSYGDYRSQIRRGKAKASMTIKKSAVIDDIMKNPVTSDLSIMSPLLELEANNSATFKGLSGLNTDRAYGLDKRTYDPSMINKLALSTGFSENIGINRQTTMDMDIEGKRGYIKNTDPNLSEDLDFTKLLSATEAVTPFGSQRDDPIRTAMTYVQTAKHSMPVDHSMPLLVTNGADEAMPYMVSDTFSFRAKDDGEITEFVPDEYMVATYKNGTSDFISLKEETKKNSDGGFYLTIKLSTDLKAKSKFKEGDILAFDAKSFSNKNGEADGLAYNVGVLAKVGILATDEGFEDSTSISQWLSEAMATTICTQIPVSLSPNVNIYEMKKIGDAVQEGDPLIIMQDSVTEKDAAILLHNITDSDYVSDLGRIKIKSKYTGIVQDIKIYRTCDISELSPSLKKVVNSYENEIRDKKKVYKNHNVPYENTLDPDYTMTSTGKLKNVVNGVLIEFYVKYYDFMGVGDKLTLQSANKGVCKMVFPEGQEPYSEFRPEEKVHALAASRSFNARMVTSPIVSGALNKGLIELDRAVKAIMGIKPKSLEDINMSN